MLNNSKSIKPNILIVDDVTSNLAVLTEMVKGAGYIARPVTSARQAMAAIDVKLPWLILLDISMPDMDGYEFCELLKKEVETREIPIIFISAMNSKEDKIRGFELGAVDFISRPFENEEVKQRINTHLKLFAMQQELEVYNKRLHKMVNDQIKKITEEEKNFILAIAKLSVMREEGGADSLRYIGRASRLLASSLQLSPRFQGEIDAPYIDAIEIASQLHDIGQSALRDTILLKEGPLTADEMELVKTHTTIGYETLAELYAMNEQNESLKMAQDIAHYHHEKWDGTGYPEKLRQTEIPLSARIVSVIDVYDALTNQRSYRPPHSHQEAMRIIHEEAGKSFDPNIVQVFEKIQNRFQKPIA